MALARHFNCTLIAAPCTPGPSRLPLAPRALLAAASPPWPPCPLYQITFSAEFSTFHRAYFSLCPPFILAVPFSPSPPPPPPPPATVSGRLYATATPTWEMKVPDRQRTPRRTELPAPSFFTLRWRLVATALLRSLVRSPPRFPARPTFRGFRAVQRRVDFSSTANRPRFVSLPDTLLV